MPYTTPHWLLNFGGTLFGVEQWSCSLRMFATAAGSDNDGVIAYANSNASAAKDIVKTWYTTASYFGTNTKLTFVKFNGIKVDGHYADDSNSHTFVISPPTAGTGSENFPPQCAIAVTLNTGAQRGLASKGRIYLPLLAQSIASTDGLIGSAGAGSITTQVATLISNLNGMPLYAAQNVVVGVLSGVRSGLSRAVTSVQVGRAVDTQRRRRKSMDEQYSTAVAVTT